MGNFRTIEIGKLAVREGTIFIGDPFMQDIEDNSDFWSDVEAVTDVLIETAYNEAIEYPAKEVEGREAVCISPVLGEGIYPVIASIDEWGNVYSLNIPLTSIPQNELTGAENVKRTVICTLTIISGLLWLGDPELTICSHCDQNHLVEHIPDSYHSAMQGIRLGYTPNEVCNDCSNITMSLAVPVGSGYGEYPVALTVDDNGEVYSLYMEFPSPAMEQISMSEIDMDNEVTINIHQ